jgi:multiple sugar transport system ATP-binding protein
MDVELKVEDGDVHLVNPYFDFRLGPENATRLQSYGKKRLILGVRPENILLVSEEDSIVSAQPLCFSAQCLVSEPQGSHQIVAIELGDKIVKIVAPAYPRIGSGEVVHLTFNQEALAFFDSDTGLRI